MLWSKIMCSIALLLISISTGIDRQPFARAMPSHENCVVNFEREMATISRKEHPFIIGSGYSRNSLLLSYIREDFYTFWAIWGGNMRLPKRNASVFSQKLMFTLRLNIHRYPPPFSLYSKTLRNQVVNNVLKCSKSTYVWTFVTEKIEISFIFQLGNK